MTDKKTDEPHWFDAFKGDGLGGAAALLGASWISSLEPSTRAALMKALHKAYCETCGCVRADCTCEPFNG